MLRIGRLTKRLLGQLRTRRSFLIFSGASTASAMAGVVAGVLTLRWVAPELMGVLQSAVVIQAWCEVTKLGVVNGMNRELPFSLGKNEEERAQAVVATSLGATLITTAFGLLGFGILTCLLWERGPAWRLAFISTGINWAAVNYSNLIQGTFRANHDFERLSRILVLDGALSIILIPMVAVWGFEGFCIRSSAQAMLLALVLHAFRPIRVRPRLEIPVLKDILAVGLPLFVAGYLFQLGNTAERSCLLAVGSVELVGLFAPALAIQSAVVMMPNTIMIYLYPKLSFKLAKTGDLAALWRQALGACIVAVAAASAVALLGWFTLPSIVPRMFPEYLNSVTAMQWALISGVFLAVRPASALMPSLKAWKYHYLWICTFVACKWVASWAFIHWLPPLEGAAIAGAASAAVAAVAILWGAYQATHPRPRHVDTQPL